MTPQIGEPAPYICYACANGRHSDCSEEACKCSHRAQPSRPAAPESETPEVDAVIYNIFSLARVARSLERRLSLAQTEIKEHKLQITRLEKDLACAQENFHVTNQAYVKADNERTQAQARIAELEKALEELLADITKPYEQWAVGSSVHRAKVALKDRA